MEVNGLFAVVNTPDALKGEGLNALPPHSPVVAYPVDEYPACPKNWMHGSSKASSYFIGVEPGKGMWFDFTSNQHHQHDIAVVVSVQGINPVTGQKTAELNLQQFKNKCPNHGCDFQQDRFCPECGYKWPAQNYIASTTGHTMWIDGFRNEKGEVRQYIITEEECKGIAAQVIGEDRVFAIGFAFYKSKKAKPEPVIRRSSQHTNCATKGGHYGGGQSSICGQSSDGKMQMNCFNTVTRQLVQHRRVEAAGMVTTNCYSGWAGTPGPQGAQGPTGVAGMSSESFATLKAENANSLQQITGAGSESVSDEAENAKLEIGAGARIEQDHGVDPNDVDFWSDEPEGLIYVNYVPVKVAQKIIAAGKRQDKKDSFMSGLEVGK